MDGSIKQRHRARVSVPLKSYLPYFSLALLWLAMAITAHAAEQYYRCVDEQGRVTFSQSPCGPSSELREFDDDIGSGPARQRSAAEQLRIMERIRQGGGGDRAAAAARPPADLCAGVTSLTLRNARVGKQLTRCHTASDVRSMFGSPQSTARWSGGGVYDTRWNFVFEKGPRLSVYFKDGRVVRWSRSR